MFQVSCVVSLVEPVISKGYSVLLKHGRLKSTFASTLDSGSYCIVDHSYLRRACAATSVTRIIQSTEKDEGSHLNEITLTLDMRQSKTLLTIDGHG